MMGFGISGVIFKLYYQRVKKLWIEKVMYYWQSHIFEELIKQHKTQIGHIPLGYQLLPKEGSPSFQKLGCPISYANSLVFSGQIYKDLNCTITCLWKISVSVFHFTLHMKPEPAHGTG
jgi:hypothetical protein